MREETLATRAQPEDARGVAIVYAENYLNKLSGERIERECRNGLEDGCHALVINFKQTTIVNSIGVSILLGVIDAVERRGARLVFANVNHHTIKLFDLLGLSRHVALAENVEAAFAILEDFDAAPTPHGH